MPLHPYTKALLSSIPIPDPDTEKQRQCIVLEGEVPSPINPKPGCRFAPRCLYALNECHSINPKFKEAEIGHYVACHLF